MISGNIALPDAGSRIPPPLLPSAPPAVPDVEPQNYEVPDQFRLDQARTPAQTQTQTQAPAETHPGEEESKPDRETIKKTVEKLNKISEGLGHRLSFDLYDTTDEFYSKVIDRRTNKVVKLLPPKEVLEFHRKLQEALGAMIDETA